MNTQLHLLNLFAFLVCHSMITIMIIPGVHSQCIPDQQQTLLNLKSSLVYNASLSSKLVTWNNRTDCCSWLGVTCSTNGRVLGLDISSESISDGIDNSSSLFHLQYLQSLNLADNQLGGDGSSIPSTFELLVSLRYLNISSNYYYSGQILVEMSRLTRLVVLDISYNWYEFYQNQSFQYLGLEIPTLNMLVENLTELRELYLDDVQISQGGNKWSQAISSSLPNLRILSMSNCNLSGPFHHSLAKLQFLSFINLRFNNFSALVPTFFANFSNLTSLNLRYCELEGTFPYEVFLLPSLREITLSDNTNLYGWLPEFPKNGSLQVLDLGWTNFSGIIPNSIGNLDMLSKFDISVCKFKGTIPQSMGNLTQLGVLRMAHNMFEGSIPSFNGAKNLERIVLGSNGLTGNINHINWTSLSKLSYLGLTANQLSENIPSALFSVSYLDLSDNQFSGQFPTISNMSSSSLTNLDLSGNNLEGPIPISIFNIQGLTDLDLSSNNFSGSFPPDGLQNFKSLVYLDLSHNNLSLNNMSTNFSHSLFPKLEVFGLASVKLRTFPNFLRNQSELEVLDLSNNEIQGTIPNWIWRLRYLSDLNLSCNFLEASNHQPMNLTSMLSLDLHSNLLHGTIPISSAPSMRYLDYSRNNFINSSIPSLIGDMLPDLIYFSLASNNLQGVIPQSICNPIMLTILDMSNNSLSGEIPQCLTSLSTLSVLNLRRNNLTSVNKVLSPNCSLQTLDLSDNQIHSEIPRALSNCVDLEVLNLGRNQMTGPFPCFLKSISSLKVLVLRSNRFHGSFGCPDQTNGSWPMLQIVDIADNNFSGNVPKRELITWQAMKFEGRQQAKADQLKYQDIDSDYTYKDTVKVTIKGVEIELEKILTIFTTVDLSCNNFSGSIPEEIGGLSALHLLNLSNNAFSGAIPISLSNLSQLESLDLSNNTLSGQIPVQLTRLTFLSFLNLSNNHLEGRIPSSTQFSTFLKSSFEGNKGLFGPPLTEDNRTMLSPPTTERSNQDSGDETNWNFISAEMGFTCGMGVAIGSLLFCKRWRIWYYMTMYGILVRVFPQLEHWFGRHRRHVYIGERHIRRRRTLR